MDNTNYPPPPPYSQATTAPYPIGFEQSQHPPQPISNAPPPLNAGMQPTSHVTYVTTPLVHQPPTVAALNATPRAYYNFRGDGVRNRKAAYIGFAVFGVVFLIFLIIFLVVFFTVFNKASKEFDEAEERHREFKRKYFPEDRW